MSSLIPQSFIDDLLNRADLVELIDGYIPLKKQGSNFVACCPFHGEKTPSFHVVAQKQFYYCFGCGASGNAISFAMEYLHQNFVEAVETLAARLGLEVPRDGEQTKQRPSKSLYELLENVCNYYQKVLKTDAKEAVDYLKNRGLSGEIAKKYQIGYAKDGWHNVDKQFPKSIKDLIATGMLITRDDGSHYDRYRERIIFPIHDRNGRIIGFGGRVIKDHQQPKYLNSPETIIFQKNRELYGLHQIISQKKDIKQILVVEGYMDVIGLAQYGVDNAVATLGTATSTYHIQLLARHTKNIIFAFDGDDAGRKAAWRALENTLSAINDGFDARFIFLPQGQDPDSLIRKIGRDSFNSQLNTAMPLNQFFFETLSQNIDTNSIAGKTMLVNKVKPFLDKIGEGPYKQILIDELARITHIDPHRIAQLTQIKQKHHELEHNKSIQRTPARVAIALLVQHPEIVEKCSALLNDKLLNSINTNIVKKLIKQILNNPKINTALLIELWRNEPEFDGLIKLAAWAHQVPESALKDEFIDTIRFLSKRREEDEINKLIEKSRGHGLTPAERIQLQDMLKKRHSDA